MEAAFRSAAVCRAVHNSWVLPCVVNTHGATKESDLHQRPESCRQNDGSSCEAVSGSSTLLILNALKAVRPTWKILAGTCCQLSKRNMTLRFDISDFSTCELRTTQIESKKNETSTQTVREQQGRSWGI